MYLHTNSQPALYSTADDTAHDPCLPFISHAFPLSIHAAITCEPFACAMLKFVRALVKDLGCTPPI